MPYRWWHEEVWVTEADVASVVAGWTGIAVEQVSQSESTRLLRLEQCLESAEDTAFGLEIVGFRSISTDFD